MAYQFSTMSALANKPDNSGYSRSMSSLPIRRTNTSDDGDDRYTYMPFGKALRHYRERAGLSQKELAAMLGHTSHSTVAGWETRADCLSSDYQMERLAKAINAPLDDLALGRVIREEAAAATAEEAAIEAAALYMSGEELRLFRAVVEEFRRMSMRERIAWVDILALARQRGHESEE